MRVVFHLDLRKYMFDQFFSPQKIHKNCATSAYLSNLLCDSLEENFSKKNIYVY